LGSTYFDHSDWPFSHDGALRKPSVPWEQQHIVKTSFFGLVSRRIVMKYLGFAYCSREATGKAAGYKWTHYEKM
jgi:hypothetical protein